MRLRNGIILGIVLSVITWVSTTSATENRDQARNLVQDLVGEAAEILSGQEGTLAQREKRFHTLLRSKIDFQFLSSLVIGRYWLQMTQEQKQEFRALFSDFFLKSYAPLLGGYPDDMTSLTGTKKFGLRDFIVGTEIKRPKRRKVSTNWRIRYTEGVFRIIDIEISGTSVGFSHKSGFTALIRKKGVDGLLDLLRIRAEKVPTQP